MSQATPVYADYDFWVPAFEVRLGGSAVSPEVLRDVLSVSYKDSLDQLDSCDITLTNWDDEANDFKYVGRTAGRPPVDFKPGLEIELWMGYHDRGGLTMMLSGEIVALSVDFPAGGQPSLQLRALNKLYKLHFKQETEVYEDMTDSQIADAVLSKMEQDLSSRPSASSPIRLQLETSSANLSIEQPHEYVVINAEYPIVFLMERARHNGYDMYIEEDDEAGVTKLHFHPPDRGVPPAYELVWGGSLVNFKPTIKTKEQIAKVTVRGWDQVAKEPIEGTATWDDLANRGLMDLAEMTAADSALSGSEVVITDEPVFNEQEAKQKAIDHLTSVANDLVSGSGSTVGLPLLRAGRPVHIRKLGPPFNGRYLVTSSTHAIADGGYTVQFDARMEEPDAEGT